MLFHRSTTSTCPLCDYSRVPLVGTDVLIKALCKLHRTRGTGLLSISDGVSVISSPFRRDASVKTLVLAVPADLKHRVYRANSPVRKEKME